MLYSKTICYKHDQIIELAKNLMSMASDFESMASHIESYASDAKDDGQSMEKGLDKKRDAIEKLESQIWDLEKERDYWKSIAEDLQKEIDNQ